MRLIYFIVPSPSWFTAYHSYADHNTFLTDLQAAYPANSEIITAGTSVQGRTIRGIHIWGSGGKGSKTAVLFHGTVHAREWISTMVSTSFVNPKSGKSIMGDAMYKSF
jgi:hypothetical protein